jgi:hypothetical protein
MDYEYWLRLGAHISFRRIPHKLAGSRFYPENKTLHNRMPVHREINNMLFAKFGEVPTKWIFNYAHTVADLKIGTPSTPRKHLSYIAVILSESLKSMIRWKKRFAVKDIRLLGTKMAKTMQVSR